MMLHKKTINCEKKIKLLFIFVLVFFIFLLIGSISNISYNMKLSKILVDQSIIRVEQNKYNLSKVINILTFSDGTIKHVDHISIQRSQWNTGSTIWETPIDENYINYIDPSWYSGVSWMGYVHVKVGRCCSWFNGCSDSNQIIHIRFKNINTGATTNEVTAQTYSSDGNWETRWLYWDLGSLSNAGYWVMEIRHERYDPCNAFTWGWENSNIYGGEIIALVSDTDHFKYADHIDILRTPKIKSSDNNWFAFNEKNYINVSLYGTKSWKCFARARAPPCCNSILTCSYDEWNGGAISYIRFKNEATGETTLSKSTTSSPSPELLLWDCGSISDAGYWVVEMKDDKSSRDCGMWGYWGYSKIYEAGIIPVVSYY